MFDFGALPVELILKIVDLSMPPVTDPNGVYKTLRRLAIAIPCIADLLDSQICYIICQDPTPRLRSVDDAKLFKDKFNHTFVDKIHILSRSMRKERTTKGEEDVEDAMNKLLTRSNVFTVDIENMPESLKSVATNEANILHAREYLMVLNLYDELNGTKTDFKSMMKWPSPEDIGAGGTMARPDVCVDCVFGFKFKSCVKEVRQRILKRLVESGRYKLIYITSDIDSCKLKSYYPNGDFPIVRLCDSDLRHRSRASHIDRIVLSGAFRSRAPSQKTAFQFNLPRSRIAEW